MIEFVYIVNNNFYTKYFKKKTNTTCLPFFDTNFKEQLVGKNIIIYTKSTGFIGIINIINIINETDDIYNSLLVDYGLGTSINLYFLQINNLCLFDKIYKYRDYFNYCKTNNLHWFFVSSTRGLGKRFFSLSR